jgi:cell division protein FtsA
LIIEAPRKIGGEEISMLFKKGEKFTDDDQYTTINAAPVYFLLGDNKRIIEPRGASSDKLKALVSYIRCKKEFTGEIESILNSVGIDVEFVSSVWAEILYFFEPNRRDRYVLFVDSGYITTELALLRGDGVLALASFSLGGANITADIAELFELSFEEAEVLKKQVDLTYKGGEATVEINASGDKILLDALNAVAAARIADITDSINDCLKNSAYDCPSHISMFLTGGGLSYIKGVTEFLSADVKKTVELVVPDADEYDKPNYSAILGLLNIAEISGKEDAEPPAIEKIIKKGPISKFLNKLLNKFGGKKE